MNKVLYKILKKDRKRGGYTRNIQKGTATKQLDSGRSLSDSMINEIKVTDKILDMKKRLEVSLREDHIRLLYRNQNKRI